MKEAKLIYASSGQNADLYYATHFLAHDPFIFIQIGKKKYLVMNDLEIDRAKKQSTVDKVLSYTDYRKKALKTVLLPTSSDVIAEVFKDFKLKKIIVPPDFPFSIALALQKKGFKLEIQPKPFFKERVKKTKQEIKYIEESQKATFASMKIAYDVLKASKVKNGKIYYKGSILTSERLRSFINIFLLEKGYIAKDTIVAGGLHAIDPHDVGSGPLRAGESIILDIFPQSSKTQYFGDATRTFCKGKAPLGLKKLYEVVKVGQEIGLNLISAGVNARKVHEAIMNFFKKEGYETTVRNGRNVGFFHSTGHGIGLECHEEPSRISTVDLKLEEGSVFTVEPGLYYPEIGGVRIEDIVVITKDSCKILGSFPKKLEV